MAFRRPPSNKRRKTPGKKTGLRHNRSSTKVEGKQKNGTRGRSKPGSPKTAATKRGTSPAKSKKKTATNSGARKKALGTKKDSPSTGSSIVQLFQFGLSCLFGSVQTMHNHEKRIVAIVSDAKLCLGKKKIGLAKLSSPLKRSGTPTGAKKRTGLKSPSSPTEKTGVKKGDSTRLSHFLIIF
jgi:hypothetical protein